MITAHLREASYADALAAYQSGLVSRRDWQIYSSVWSWSADRYGGRAGRVQERFYQRHGSDRYWQRIAEVRAYGVRLGLIADPLVSGLY